MERALLFSKSVIPSLVKEEAVERLQWHKDNKHNCILVSASIHNYLDPWAKKMGFSRVMATELEVDYKGCITGKFTTRNCKGFEKVRRIKESLKDLEKYEIYVYGDSRGDKELLEIADHPFYRSFKKEREYPG